MIVKDSARRGTIITSHARVEGGHLHGVRVRLLGDTEEMRLLSLDNLIRRRSLKLSAKNHIPEAAGDTEAIVKVSEVVLKVILLELLIVERKAETSLALVM